MTHEQFAQCVEHYYSHLVGLAWQWTENWEDAEDAVQTVLVAMARLYQTVDAAKAINYLRRAVSRAARASAKASRALELSSQRRVTERYTPVSHTTEAERVEQALARLPPHVRYLVQLVYYSGYTVGEAKRLAERRFGRVIHLREATQWVKFKGKTGRTARGQI